MKTATKMAGKQPNSGATTGYEAKLWGEGTATS